MEGKIVQNEKDAYGCKVEIVIHHPDMGIVFDEVGSNILQESNNFKGGERYLTGVHDQAYMSCTTKKYSQFICLGVTMLERHPLTCCNTKWQETGNCRC